MAPSEGQTPLAEAPATVQFQLPMVVNISNPSEYVTYSPEKSYIMYKPEHPQPLAVPLWGRVIRAGKAKLPKKNADGIVARDEQGQVIEVESPDVSIVIVEHAPDSSGRVYQTKLVGKFVVSPTIVVGTSVATGQSITNAASAVRFDMSLKDPNSNTLVLVHPEEEGRRLASDLTKQAQAKRQAELDAAQLAQRSAPKPLQAPPEWQVYHAFGSANESGEPRPLTTIHLTTKNSVVRAFLPGTVTNVTPSLPPARGSVVIIAHANGMHSTFRGLAQIDVKVGDTVFAGQTTIGLASLTDRRFEYGISRGASNGRPNWVDPFAIDAKEFVRLDMFPPILNDDQAIIQARIATHPNAWPVSMSDPEHEPQQNLFFAHLKDPAINILFEQAWRLEQRREVYSDSPMGLLKSVYEIWLEAADRQRQGLLADWHFKYGDVLDAARNAVSAQWIAIQKAYDTGETISWQQVERLKTAMEYGAGNTQVSDFIWSAPIGDLPTVFGALRSIWNDGFHPERIPDGQDMTAFRQVRANIYDHCRHHFWDLHVGNSAAVSQRLESHILSAPTDVLPIKEAQKGIATFETEVLSLLEPKTQYKSAITRTQNQFTREFCTARAMGCIKNLYQSPIIAVSEQLEALYNSTPDSPQFDAAIEQIIIQIAPDVPAVMRRHQVKAIVDVVRSKTAQATTPDQKKAGITTARKYLVTEDKNGRKSVGEMFLINSHHDFTAQHPLYVKTYQNTLYNVAQKLPKLLEAMPEGKDQEEVINQAIDTENAKAPNGVFPALVANQKLQMRVSLQNDVMTYVNLTQIPTLLKNADFTQKVWLPDKAVNKLQQIWSQISVSLDGNAEFIAMVTAEVKRVKPTATQAEIVRACSEAKTRLYMAGLFQAVEKIRLREALRNKEHASDIDAEIEKNPELRVYVEATWVRGMLLEVSDDDAMKVGEFVVQNILITAATMGAGLLIRGAVAATFEATATGAANLASRMAPSLSSGLERAVNWNLPYASQALAATDGLASTAGTTLGARALALTGQGSRWVVGHTIVSPLKNIAGTVAMVTEYGLGWEAMNFANNLFTAGSNDSLLRGSAFGANDLLPWAAQAFQHASILFVANMAGTVGTAWITSLADKVPSAWAKLGVRMFGAALQSIITTPAVRFAGDFAGSYNRLPAWEETNPMNLLESFFQDLTIEQFAQLATFCFLAGRITPATVKKYSAEVQKSWADLQDSFRGLMAKRPANPVRTEPTISITPPVVPPAERLRMRLDDPASTFSANQRRVLETQIRALENQARRAAGQAPLPRPQNTQVAPTVPPTPIERLRMRLDDPTSTLSANQRRVLETQIRALENQARRSAG